MQMIKDPNIKGRKFNGRPYLKLHRVKAQPRTRIRALLRSFAPLEHYPAAANDSSNLM